MKRVVFASFVVVPIVGGTQPMIADPAAAQSAVEQLKGYYAGLWGGGAWGNSDQTDAGVPSGGQTAGTTFGDGHYDVDGGLIGGGIGYNHPFGSWLAGIEADLSYASISGSSSVCGPPAHACGTELKSYLGTVRGRLGPTWERWFVYGTGGLAYGRVHAWDALFGTSGSETRVGWTAGGGVEAAFAPNWSGKVEYLYVDLGSGHLYDIVPGVPETVSFDAHVVRLGVSYHFNAPTGPR